MVLWKLLAKIVHLYTMNYQLLFTILKKIKGHFAYPLKTPLYIYIHRAPDIQRIYKGYTKKIHIYINHIINLPTDINSEHHLAYIFGFNGLSCKKIFSIF